MKHHLCAKLCYFFFEKVAGIPELARYERFVKDWHFFLKDTERKLAEAENEEIPKKNQSVPAAAVFPESPTGMRFMKHFMRDFQRRGRYSENGQKKQERYNMRRIS